jgi:hypothetical protein
MCWFIIVDHRHWTSRRKSPIDFNCRSVHPVTSLHCSMILSLTWLETAHLGFSIILSKHSSTQATSSGCIPLSKWILMDDTPAPYRISSLRYGWHQILPFLWDHKQRILSGAHTSKLELRLVSWDVLQLGHFCNQPLLLLVDVISWCGFVGGFFTFKSWNYGFLPFKIYI